MGDEKVVEEHEYTRTETEDGTSESHRDTVVEHDKGGKQEVVVEKEKTVETRE